jgi:beta-glucosidase
MPLRNLLFLPFLLVAATPSEGQVAVSQARSVPAATLPTDPALRGALYLDPKAPLERRVEDLFQRLTPEERASLIHGSGGFADYAGIPRVGLPTLVMTDGPQGVRTSVPTTGFPSGIAMAATWNPALMERVGQVLGREARATGHTVLLGPGMDILRTPLAGRNFEYFGEDPLLSGRTAAGYIRGVQSQGVAACMKHIALNDQEMWRLGVSAEADERTLHEAHVRAYAIAIREAHPWAAMPAYNRVNGEYCAQNATLLRQVFRHDLGFDGCFISDWGAWGETVKALPGGCDLEMPADRNPDEDRNVLAMVRDGRIRQADFDGAVKSVLRMVFRVGALDPARPAMERLAPDTAPLARKVAQEAMVLLKNEGRTLPLRAEGLKRILVVGPNADHRHSMPKGGEGGLRQSGGSGAIFPPYELTALESFRERLGVRVDTYPWDLEGGGVDAEGLARAAKAADVVVFVGGLSHADDHEGLCLPTPDRTSLDLPGPQAESIRTLRRANPRTVVVLQGGSPMSLEGWVDDVPAVLLGWYPGQEGNRALVDVLLGASEPGGRLPVTLGRRLEDWRVHRIGAEAYPGLRYNDQGQVIPPPAKLSQSSPGITKVFYKEGVALGYRGFEADGITPRFPFGHGLSYTTFTYGAPKVETAPGGAFTLVVPVENQGKRRGSTVVQIYAVPPRDAASLPEAKRPFRGLVAFQKANLAPGQRTVLRIPVTSEALQSWDPDAKGWRVFPGTWTLEVAASSADVRKRVTLAR